MTPADIVNDIKQRYLGVSVSESDDDYYIFYNPPRLPADDRFPFLTIVTADRHDRAPNLDRPGVFRLNIGIRPETYERRFGTPPKFSTDGSIPDLGCDFAAIDTLMPHPIYAAMHWVCVLKPCAETYAGLRPLLDEAYALAVHRRGTP